MEIQERPLPLINYSCGVLLGFLPIAAYFSSTVHWTMRFGILISSVAINLQRGDSLFHRSQKHLRYCLLRDGAPSFSVKGFGGIYRSVSF